MADYSIVTNAESKATALNNLATEIESISKSMLKAVGMSGALPKKSTNKVNKAAGENAKMLENTAAQCRSLGTLLKSEATKIYEAEVAQEAAAASE